MMVSKLLMRMLYTLWIRIDKPTILYDNIFKVLSSMLIDSEF